MCPCKLKQNVVISIHAEKREPTVHRALITICVYPCA